jgi:acetoin utilization protein AcuB
MAFGFKGGLNMLIQNWMSRPVVTIDAGASMPMARDLLKQHNIHCLPVMKKNKLVGILTDSDLKRASASDATSLDVYELAYLLQKIRIDQIMTPDPITIAPDYTLAEAADIFLKNNISALPVMKGQDQMVGIITPSDISRSFLCLTAAGRQGIQIGVQVEDQAGIVMSLIDIIRSAGGRIGSLISIDSFAPEGHRHVYIKIYSFDRRQLAMLIPQIRSKGTLLYIIDHKENSRDIFPAA